MKSLEELAAELVAEARNVEPEPTSGPAALTRGNGRLTSIIGLVLLLPIAVEIASAARLGQLLSLHIFLGLALIAPITLKIATTGYRFMRYYFGNQAYVTKGPPQIVLRVMAPLLVVASIAVFGSGLLLVTLSNVPGWVDLLHKVGFVLFSATVGIHVLAHTVQAWRLTLQDMRTEQPVRGTAVRRILLVVSLVVGVAFAIGLPHHAASTF